MVSESRRDPPSAISLEPMRRFNFGLAMQPHCHLPLLQGLTHHGCDGGDGGDAFGRLRVRS